MENGDQLGDPDRGTLPPVQRKRHTSFASTGHLFTTILQRTR